MKSFVDLYHLRRGRFWIDAKEDSSFYFGGTQMDKQLIDRLRMEFVQPPGVPKFMIHGRYGAGKTHTLGHIKHALTEDPRFIYQATRPLLFQLPPLKTRDKWVTLHRQFIDAIGLELTRQAIAGVMTKATPGTDPIEVFKAPGMIRFGESALQNSQAHIYRNLLFGGRQATLSWEWLKGKPLNFDATRTLGVETQLEEPSQLVDALLNVANIVSRGLGSKIVLLVDEAESMRNITSPDSFDEFVHGFRRLEEDENDVLGLIIAFQLEGGMEDAPRILVDDAVRRRVGYEMGYIDLHRLISEMEDARKFILETLEYLVDQDAAKKTIKQESLNTEPEFFPFTVEAVDRIAVWVSEEPAVRMIPSQIIEKMSNAVSKARLLSEDEGLDKPKLVDDSIVDAVLYPGEAA